ncbi:peptidase S8/S53 domain-containing protein [Syncephalis plumigaleata]|nr:peptidase S8/S53 domain-containing protein [Syncephalis plumigaleata]
MKIIKCCPAIALLLTQYIHVGLALVWNYKIDGPKDDPVVVSEITGKQMDTMPYYADTGVKDAHLRGYSGKGIHIGIIDGISQVQYTSTAQDSRERWNAEVFQCNSSPYICHHLSTSPFMFNSNSICKQYGAELTGIIKANTKSFKGVAPASTVNIYQTASCTQETTAASVLNALRMAAHQHHVDIITLPEVRRPGATMARELHLEIIKVSQLGVILLAEATTKNSIDRDYFSYKNVPVLLIGGARMPFRPSHWFTGAQGTDRYGFSSFCLGLKYNMDPVQIVPVTLTETPSGIVISDNVEGKIAMVIEHQVSTVSLMYTMKQAKAIVPSTNLFTTISDSNAKYGYTDGSYAAVAYAAGAVALLLEATMRKRPGIDFVRRSLQNTASPIKIPSHNDYIPIIYQGAGLLNVNKAILNELTVAPSAVHFKRHNMNRIRRLIFPVYIRNWRDTKEINVSFHHPTMRYPKLLTSSLQFTTRASGNSVITDVAEVKIGIVLPQIVPPNEEWHYSGYYVVSKVRQARNKVYQTAYIPYYTSIRGSLH